MKRNQTITLFATSLLLTTVLPLVYLVACSKEDKINHSLSPGSIGVKPNPNITPNHSLALEKMKLDLEINGKK